MSMNEYMGMRIGMCFSLYLSVCVLPTFAVCFVVCFAVLCCGFTHEACLELVANFLNSPVRRARLPVTHV